MLTLAGAGDKYELVKDGNNWNVSEKKNVIELTENNTKISEKQEISAEYGKSLAELLPGGCVTCMDNGEIVEGSWSWLLPEDEEASQMYPSVGETVYTGIFTPASKSYGGTIKCQFPVKIQAADLNNSKRFAFGFETLTLVCNGTAIRPKLSRAEDTLWPEENSNRSLKENIDYTLTCSGDSSEPGIYTIAITGIGTYTGTRTDNTNESAIKESSSDDDDVSSAQSDTSGQWVRGEDGKWNLTDTHGRKYINTWVEAFNPYADAAAGQNAYGWFLFDAKGAVVTGWYTDAAGDIYYLNPVCDNTQGAMVTGWRLIDGKYYYFNETSNGTKGKLLKNTFTPDGYYVDENGVWAGKEK